MPSHDGGFHQSRGKGKTRAFTHRLAFPIRQADIRGPTPLLVLEIPSNTRPICKPCVLEIAGGIRGGKCYSPTCRTHLPRDSITCHSGDATVPEPRQRLDTGFDTCMLWHALGCIIGLLLVREAVPLGNQPCSDEQDITFPRSDFEVSTHGLQRGERD
jgi:hypothetical protein